MRTDKKLLAKGVKLMGYTVVLLFLAPFVIYQAFKNQAHAAYMPVLIVGLLLGIVAIALGFYMVKVLLDALFGPKKK